MKLYLTPPDDQQSENSLSAGGAMSSGSASVLTPATLYTSTSTATGSDFDYDTSDADDNLSETDDDDDLWNCDSAVLEQTHV